MITKYNTSIPVPQPVRLESVTLTFSLREARVLAGVLGSVDHGTGITSYKYGEIPRDEIADVTRAVYDACDVPEIRNAR